MKTLTDFTNVLQGLVATLHSNFPTQYSHDFIVSSATEFQLFQNAPEETKNNVVSKRCLRIREMEGVTVAVAHARLYEDTVKYYQMVQGEKSAKMFLNNLGCNNNGKRYSQNRRWLRMVNKKHKAPQLTQKQSNRPTKHKKRPSPLICVPSPCPQLAQKRQYTYAKSGDASAVGTKRPMSINEILNPHIACTIQKKARQQCPATQTNHQPRGHLDKNEIKRRHTTDDIKQKTKKHKSVESSFAMYHPGVSDHAICTVTDTKGLQAVHRTFLTTCVHGKTMAECKRAYEMHYSELSADKKTYSSYHGGDWHQYHCFWHRTNHTQGLDGRAPRLSFTKN
jgi:hypothetical protein